MTQGEEAADSMFIVYVGSLAVTVQKEGEKPTRVATLRSKACLGEMALLYNSTRTATVQASSMSPT